jgi:2-polyprenyl-3-methyl-5-hydroxy-6-metoxy-1,4-benzoquinol methylase
MKIVKYDEYEIKMIETQQEYQTYVDQQSGRSGIPVNHNNFIRDIDEMLNVFDITKNDNIIDVGCRGNAKVLINLRDLGYKNVYGIDIGYDAETQWKQLPADLQENLKRADVHEGIPFDVKFKVITCSHVLEHCFNPEQVIKHFYDSLEDGGILHLQIPLSKYDEYINHAPHYSYWPDEQTFELWLSNLGFEVIRSINAQKINGRPVSDDYCTISKKVS